MSHDLHNPEILSQADLDAAMARGRYERSQAARTLSVSLFRLFADSGRRLAAVAKADRSAGAASAA